MARVSSERFGVVPRWKPWSKTSATLSLSASSSFHRWSALRLDAISGLDIDWCGDPLARYEHPEDVYGFEGSSAIAAAFQHKNFAFALLGGAWLILSVPFASLTGKMNRRPR